MAIMAIMATTYDLHSLHSSEDLPSSAASELKNTFKSVFQHALQSGPVSITRNRKREAILLSAELYDQMIAEIASKDPLEAFRREYEVRFAAMQSKEARKAYEEAFSASPEELGEAAVAKAMRK